VKKIKVAHIITRMIIGGAQENTLFTVQGLQLNKDYEVSLLTGPSNGPEGALLNEIDHDHIRIINLPFLTRNLNPFFDFFAFTHIFFHLLINRYDIVHTHSAKAGILGRLAAKICGVTLIIHTIHGLPFNQYQKPFLNNFYIFLERISAGWTDKIITVCDDMIRQCQEAHIAEKSKFQTIYSGLDIPTFLPDRKERVKQLRDELAIPLQAFVVGKIGRLFYLKGHEYLLEAVKKVIVEEPQVYFLLVGGGVLEGKLKEKAEMLGITKQIVFTGLVSTQEIPVYLRVMDMVVHVSLREGLPRVIPQAFLSERPVVAFDVDGARDIITDRENGFLVEPKHVDLLADRILKLVRSKKLRLDFSNAGKAFAMKNFSKEKMVAEIEKVYQSKMA